MRQIKIRGWSEAHNEWVFGNLVQGNYTDGSKFCHIEIADANEHRVYQVAPKLVGQIIGLKDKHLVEIYKGDIISDSTGRLMLVDYNNELASFCLKSKGWAFLHYFGEAVDASKTEVIGNVYQNPELLK